MLWLTAFVVQVLLPACHASVQGHCGKSLGNYLFEPRQSSAGRQIPAISDAAMASKHACSPLVFC